MLKLFDYQTEDDQCWNKNFIITGINLTTKIVVFTKITISIIKLIKSIAIARIKKKLDNWTKRFINRIREEKDVDSQS